MFGPCMPVGMFPPRSFHCTGPLEMSQPVVSANRTEASPAWNVTGSAALMTQLPLGGAGLGGGADIGLHPARVTVAVKVCRSDTTALQSSERKFEASTW